MTVVYVAGPMNGIPDHNVPAFMEAEARLMAAGYHVITPVMPEDAEGYTAERPYAWFLKRALKKMLEADGIAFLPGSQNSNGARLEKYVAEKLDYLVGTVDEWCEGKVHAGDS